MNRFNQFCDKSMVKYQQKHSLDFLFQGMDNYCHIQLETLCVVMFVLVDVCVDRVCIIKSLLSNYYESDSPKCGTIVTVKISKFL